MSDIILDGKTYSDLGITGGVHLWQNQGTGLVTSFSDLTSRVNLTKEKVNVLTKLYYPTVADTGGACACPGDVLSDAYFDVNARYSKTSTPAVRAFMLQAVRDWVNSAKFAAVFQNLNNS